MVQRAARTSHDAEAALRIGMPSGVLVVAAKVESSAGQWVAEQGAFYRTARRLFDGTVYVRASRVARAAGSAARAGEARDHPVRDVVASRPASTRRGA
jgi:hypothetical protein